jgi:hypothetical protein
MGGAERSTSARYALKDPSALMSASSSSSRCGPATNHAVNRERERGRGGAGPGPLVTCLGETGGQLSTCVAQACHCRIVQPSHKGHQRRKVFQLVQTLCAHGHIHSATHWYGTVSGRCMPGGAHSQVKADRSDLDEAAEAACAATQLALRQHGASDPLDRAVKVRRHGQDVGRPRRSVLARPPQVQKLAWLGPSANPRTPVSLAAPCTPAHGKTSMGGQTQARR